MTIKLRGICNKTSRRKSAIKREKSRKEEEMKSKDKNEMRKQLK